MIQLPISRRFLLHELGEGIYAAIHAPGGWARTSATSHEWEETHMTQAEAKEQDK